MTTRVLFVCLGNICRSPSAEGVFGELAAGLDVTTDSAGTSNWHVGEPPFAPMLAAAIARGYDLSDLRSRQFKAEDFSRHDLIIGMDADNLRDMERLRPPGNDTPVVVFTDFVAAHGADHVPDPYYTGDYDGVLELIEEASRGLMRHLGTQGTDQSH